MSPAAVQSVPGSAAETVRVAGRWTPVCHLRDLEPERGVAALVDDAQVALFLLHDGSVHAVDHLDPYSGAHVMARGIVGTATLPDGTPTPTVASPMYKQVFDLLTGACLTDAVAALRVWNVRVVDGLVAVAAAGAP